jgi:geranylgeranyl diphosphate synthase type I
MTLANFTPTILPQLEKEILAILTEAQIDQDDSLFQLLSHHMGFHGETVNPKLAGKRIRPLLALLAAEAVCGDWRPAISIAATIEVLHNFSLIHDDIEDNSPTRRGNPTVWSKVGVPLAINAGDAMFSLVFLSLGRLPDRLPAEIKLQAWQLISEACLDLTKGQHLDISFEAEQAISISAYLQMISGKTAALIASSAQAGALVAQANPETQAHYRQFGRALGLAFQIQDDILGIWGDPEVTGKSAATDLLARKKTLPILYGLEQKGRFHQFWQRPITPENVNLAAEQLRSEGAHGFALQEAKHYTELSRSSLTLANPRPESAGKFEELLAMLLLRDL